jgi:hypothetical protein
LRPEYNCDRADFCSLLSFPFIVIRFCIVDLNYVTVGLPEQKISPLHDDHSVVISFECSRQGGAE